MKRLVIALLVAFCCLDLSAGNRVEICKKDFSLDVISDAGDTLMTCKIAWAVNDGPKTRVGDHKTPEGVFHITMIYDSSQWHHDFHDGKGEIYGCYGPLFMRLDVPGFSDIGIHGTHRPESIGTQATEGCIRLRNEDIRRLYKYVAKGTQVTIRPE